MNREELDQAAFWDQAVCLDCGSTHEGDVDVCPTCGSDAVYSAQFLQRVAVFLAEE